MQSRLGFAIATSVEPEILIVDEVLGAGDAYFMTKSIGRMSQLIDRGASVLLVSHALEHVLRFCSEAIWLERGQIVERGPALEVVKSYSEFIRVLEEQEAQGAEPDGAAGAATSRGRRRRSWSAACARRPRPGGVRPRRDQAARGRARRGRGRRGRTTGHADSSHSAALAARRARVVVGAAQRGGREPSGR